MKKHSCAWILLILLTVVAYGLSLSVQTNPWLACLKYCSYAFMIFLFPIVCMASLHVPRIQHRRMRKLCFYVGYGVLLFYLFLTLDTYVFHAWSWYPGILRYAIFDACGLPYAIFILPGCLLYAGSKEMRL